jgi:hypothetical protein
MSYDSDAGLGHMQLGLVMATCAAAISGTGYVLMTYPIEAMSVVGMIGGLFGGLYLLGFATSKVIALTPPGRLRAADAAHHKTDRAYADKVPSGMVVLHGGKDGKYGGAVYSLLGANPDIHGVGPGSLDEIVLQAQSVSDQHGVNAFCVFVVDEHRTVTFLKSVDGNWEWGFDDEGSAGIGRLKSRAAAAQRKFDKLAA